MAAGRASTRCRSPRRRRSSPISIARRYEPVAIRIDKEGRWAIADRPPTAMSAADVIEQARLEAARPVRGGREVHLVARPSEETILSIDRRTSDKRDQGQAVVTGLNLDVIFPVLHGPYGEDGTIQGLLELANVPYVGAGVLASAVGMDKAIMKLVFSARGLPVCPYRVVMRHEWQAAREQVARRPDRRPRLSDVRQAGQSRIERRHLEGQGCGRARRGDGSRRQLRPQDRRSRPRSRTRARSSAPCSATIEPSASVPGEVVPSREFYDYEAKYLDDGSKILIPAELPDATAAEVQRLAVAAFQAIDCAGHGARRLPARAATATGSTSTK